MKRPLSVLVFGFLFIFAGALGIGYHLARRPLEPDLLSLTVLRLLAIVGGIFLLSGRNWARWLLVAWLAFHIGVSFFHSIEEIVLHTIFLFLFGFVLFRSPVSDYFHRRP